MSDDGAHVFVSSTEDIETHQSSQGGIWDHVAGRFVPVTRSMTTFLGQISSDGRWATLSASTRLTADDTDDRLDGYLRTPTGLRLITVGTPDSDAFVVHIASDGSSAVFRTRDPVTAEDTDSQTDYYRWDAMTGDVTLLTLAMSSPQFVASSDDERHVVFRENGGVSMVERVGDAMVERGRDGFVTFSSDGARFYFSTAASMVPEDPSDSSFDGYYSDVTGFHLLTGSVPGSVGLAQVSTDEQRLLLDTYEPLTSADTDATRDLYIDEGGSLTLASIGDVEFGAYWATPDLRSIVLRTLAGIDPDDEVDSWDLYRWTSTDPDTALRLTPVHDGAPTATVDALSPDGSRVVFETIEALLPGDTDTGYAHLYEWHGGTVTNLAPGSMTPIEFQGASADGRRVAFASAESLVQPDDVPGGLYISDADLTPPVATISGPPGGVSGATASLQLDTATHDGVWFDCQLDGSTVTPCDPTARFTGLAAGKHTVKVFAWDAADNQSTTPAAKTWTVDRGSPTITKPITRVQGAVSTDPSGVVIRVSWSASDALSPIDHYDVEQQVNGGSWAAVASGIHSASTSRTLLPNLRYRFRVRATDTAQNTGFWASGDEGTISSLSERSSSIKYAGAWSSSSSAAYWGGTTRRASKAGATATVTVKARSIGWISRIGPTRGSARVYVDGAYVATVDLHATSAAGPRIVWATSWSSLATHSVRIRVSGSTGHPSVDIDGFIVIH